VGFVYCDNDGDGVYTTATIPHVSITLQYQTNAGAWQNWLTSPYQQTNDKGWYGYSESAGGHVSGNRVAAGRLHEAERIRRRHLAR